MLNRHMTVQRINMPQPRKYASHAARQAAYHHRREQARQQQLSAKGLPPTPALPSVPGYPRWRQAIEQARLLIEMVNTEMQDYVDERSEQWQESERAETFREQIDSVTEVCAAISGLDL